MAILKVIHLPFILALLLLCIPTPVCQAQADAVQIVSRAALCFDNRPVMNGCLQSMGINIPGFGNTTTTAVANDTLSDESAPAPAPSSATGMCGAPCYGQMMLLMQCMDGIMSNFQGYQSGLMQGVQAIFQMSCGVQGNGNGGGAGGGVGGIGGGGGGGVGGIGGGAGGVGGIGGGGGGGVGGIGGGAGGVGGIGGGAGGVGGIGGGAGGVGGIGGGAGGGVGGGGSSGGSVGTVSSSGSSGAGGGGSGSGGGGNSGSSQSGVTATTNGGSHLAAKGQGNTNGIGSTTPNLRFLLLPLLFTVIYLILC